MRLAILTAVHGRQKLTKMFFEYYKYQNVDAICASVSMKSDLESIVAHGVMEAFIENDPVSQKWQFGLERLRHAKPDAVMILGSDDFVTPEYIRACKYLIQGGAEYVYLPGCYFFDAIGKRMIWGSTERLGLGRCLSAGLLDRLDWKLWPGDLSHGLDGAMWERVQNLGSVKHLQLTATLANKYVGLDVKTGENMWSFDHVRDNVISFDVSPASVLDKYFPSISSQLMNWEVL